jgi:hypothetical protein
LERNPSARKRKDLVDYRSRLARCGVWYKYRNAEDRALLREIEDLFARALRVAVT